MVTRKGRAGFILHPNSSKGKKLILWERVAAKILQLGALLSEGVSFGGKAIAVEKED